MLSLMNVDQVIVILWTLCCSVGSFGFFWFFLNVVLLMFFLLEKTPMFGFIPQPLPNASVCHSNG
jgi:hypothetical protein